MQRREQYRPGSRGRAETPVPRFPEGEQPEEKGRDRRRYERRTARPELKDARDRDGFPRPKVRRRHGDEDTDDDLRDWDLFIDAEEPGTDDDAPDDASEA